MKILNNNKGFTLIELIVSIVIGSILSVAIFNGIQDIILSTNKDKIIRDVYSEISQGATKIQKIIYENGVTIFSVPNTEIESGDILSFSKEDLDGIENTYYLKLDNTCTTSLGSNGKKLIITDGINESISITKCIYDGRNKLTVETKYLDINIKEKILNILFYIENNDTGIREIIKTTIFVK